MPSVMVGRLALLFALGSSLAACAHEPSAPPQQAQLGEAIAPPSRLAPPEDLPEPARARLRARMASHARDMGGLMNAVMILDYERISSQAASMAADETFVRPFSEEDRALESALPERFFGLQEELKERAAALSQAAGREAAFDVADAYGQLAQTCVRCHATYRGGPAAAK